MDDTYTLYVSSLVIIKFSKTTKTYCSPYTS